jgi:hypothetical protein
MDSGALLDWKSRLWLTITGVLHTKGIQRLPGGFGGIAPSVVRQDMHPSGRRVIGIVSPVVWNYREGPVDARVWVEVSKLASV